MKFCIAPITFWQSVGFDTENWRTSTDGLKALCHDKFAQTLVPDANEHVQILDIDSDEFKHVIATEFTKEEDVDESS